jgi:flagellum-specific ATP synthase
MKSASIATRMRACTGALRQIGACMIEGRVASVAGQAVEVDGFAGLLAVGDRLDLIGRDGNPVSAVVVGFPAGAARAMPFAALEGIGPGLVARAAGRQGATFAVSDGWLGRVIDPLGRPADGKGALPAGRHARPLRAKPPDATSRTRLGPRLDLGVRALDCFATCRRGQRLGLFAGSGIGKSTLLGMLARSAGCDVAVLALVGERGREVREFLEDELGPDGLARSVVVVATSDASPLLRRQAAEAAMTVAEHFRDAGKNVLLLMDSLTRYCLALREIGLAAGEPPATRGYPPSVFSELPRLLERAGPGTGIGCITALFTVLVEGDDTNEPVSDAVRGILDGHVILDRRIAESGRYPPVDVLRSLSRAAAGSLSPEEAALVRRARGIMAVHADIVDLVRLGAYRPGTDAAADEALALMPGIEAVLRQDRSQWTPLNDAFALLRAALEAPHV